MKIKDKNSEQFIKQITPYGIATCIALVIGGILNTNGSEETGLIILIVSFVALIIFFLLFIPNAQQIEITDRALVINAYNHHRSYFWYQIYDVYVKEQNNREVVIKISKNINDNKNKEIIPYIDVPINAQAFGYDPEELFKLIKMKIQP